MASMMTATAPPITAVILCAQAVESARASRVVSSACAARTARRATSVHRTRVRRSLVVATAQPTPGNSATTGTKVMLTIAPRNASSTSVATVTGRRKDLAPNFAISAIEAALRMADYGTNSPVTVPAVAYTSTRRAAELARHPSAGLDHATAASAKRPARGANPLSNATRRADSAFVIPPAWSDVTPEKIARRRQRAGTHPCCCQTEPRERFVSNPERWTVPTAQCRRARAV
jgi:hypothetical protein